MWLTTDSDTFPVDVCVLVCVCACVCVYTRTCSCSCMFDCQSTMCSHWLWQNMQKMYIEVSNPKLKRKPLVYSFVSCLKQIWLKGILSSTLCPQKMIGLPYESPTMFVFFKLSWHYSAHLITRENKCSGSSHFSAFQLDLIYCCIGKIFKLKMVICRLEAWNRDVVKCLPEAACSILDGWLNWQRNSANAKTL